MEQAATALVATFADVGAAEPTERVPFAVEAGDDEELLVLLLEELLYVIDVLGVVPVATELDESPPGQVVGSFQAVPVSAVEEIGALPKAISRHGLRLGTDGQRWACRVTVDV